MKLNKKEKLEFLASLNQFTGSELFHRFNPFRRQDILTDGALHVARRLGAFWLMTEISNIQNALELEHFQVWKLKLKSGGGAVITAEDGNDNVIAKKSIPFTDFPLDEITVWAERNELGGITILLPSEH